MGSRGDGGVFPRTVTAHLDEYCTDAELALWRDSCVVIYTVLNAKGETRYYVGGNPLEPSWPEFVDPRRPNIRPLWDLVPEPLKTFYETVHDGFHNFRSSNFGLSPLSDVTCLGARGDEWPERLAGSYTFLHLGGIQGLALDINGPKPGQPVMWLWNVTHPELDFDFDFWEKLDELIVLPFNTLEDQRARPSPRGRHMR